MTTIPQEIVLERWDTLPNNLKDELVSEPNSNFLWKTCEAEHIPDERIYDAARIVSYVLLGFLHPGDLGEELAEALTINRQVADSIARAVNDRILNPLKDELDEIYEPPSKLAPPVPLSEPPKPVEEIKIAPEPTAPPPKPSPYKISEGNLGGQAAPVGEFAKFGLTKESAPSFAKATEGKEPIRQAQGEPPVVSGIEPPPTMLHEETVIKPAAGTSSFKIEAPTPKLSDIKFGKSAAEPSSAIVSFGKPSAPPPAKTAAAESKPPRIVHYTEFRTPLGELPENKPAETGGQAPPNIPFAESNPSQISAGNLRGQAAPPGELARPAAEESFPEPTKTPPPVPPKPTV